MPDNTDDRYTAIFRRALLIRAGPDPDAGSIAEAALGIWQQMLARLAPVIGDRGLDVVLGRSLHLAGPLMPWTDVAANSIDRPARLEHLGKRLAACGTEVATQASLDLLTTFVRLLGTMIGDSLTDQLLHPVWLLPAPGFEEENRM